MRIFLSISVLMITIQQSFAGFSFGEMNDINKIHSDTLIKKDSIENKIISEIIQQKSVPQKETVQYIGLLTKYGFKDLFNTYSYNSSLPYKSQVNPNAELYMRDYLTNHKKFLLEMKGWGMPYFNLIDNIFRAYGLPCELKYLAVIESSLQTHATSWVGAAGPWQFMPATARDYGLAVNNYVDERRDYFKSTHAAARLLLYLYNKLNDWLLVIAAYNGGLGRVYEAQAKSGSKNFWKLQYHLPEESRNHVKKFIATHYIMENNSGSNFYLTANEKKRINTLTEEEKLLLSNKKISGKYNSVVIAKNLSMDIVQFNRYNSNFDEAIATTGEYELNLPKDKMDLFTANKYQILNECIQVILEDNIVPAPQQNNAAENPKKSNKKRS